MPWHWVSAVHLLKLEGVTRSALKVRKGTLVIVVKSSEWENFWSSQTGQCVTYFIPAILMVYGI